MDKINVVYFGNIASVADEIFLSNDFNLLAVICEKGRLNSDLLTFCYLREIEFFEAKDKDHLESLTDNIEGLDIIIVCGFGIIISESLLEKFEAFNFHTGELPKYRGRHPIFFATIANERMIGITLHKMTKKIDEGGIISIDRILYSFEITEHDILKILHKSVRRLLPHLKDFIDGKISLIENKGGKYFRPVSKKDKVFNIDTPPSKILSLLRAQAGYEGGIFEYGRHEYLIGGAHVDMIKEEYEERGKLIYKNKEIIGIKIDNKCVIIFENMKNINV